LGDVFAPLFAGLKRISAVKPLGRVVGSRSGTILVEGLSGSCKLGDGVVVRPSTGQAIPGEVLRLERDHVAVLLSSDARGIALGDRVVRQTDQFLYPHESWIGRIMDSRARPLDGKELLTGARAYACQAPPPAAAERRAFGPRLETRQGLFNTILPIVQGQRIGLFAGSGVGKTTLIGRFARDIEADVTVIALVGERGRELRDFTEKVLGQAGLRRSVVVVETSDKSPLDKRRAAWSAVSIAEYFRDQGKQVLFILDSVTRFAEAHREIALLSGEPATMRGFPPSTSQLVMSLCERTGPGAGGGGDITAIFSVLVAGSDMEEPLADIVRGVLDGHVVLDRTIAERGRFPAVDVLRSVSRSLPEAASDGENLLIQKARKVLGTYESAQLMIRSGLYAAGSDPEIDEAIEIWPKLEAFFAESQGLDTGASFARLAECLGCSEQKDDT